MRFNKKGDLALSTNAIVVLIVAVIILGLIITFITQGFSAVADRFTGEFNKIEPPPIPNAREQITQTGLTVISPGAEFGWKIMIFNPGPETYEYAFPHLKCLTDDVVIAPDPSTSNSASVESSLVAFPQTIPARNPSTVYEVTGRILETAQPGKQLCQLQGWGLQTGDTTFEMFAKRDITLEIKK